jgi:hypothetical protein
MAPSCRNMRGRKNLIWIRHSASILSECKWCQIEAHLSIVNFFSAVAVVLQSTSVYAWSWFFRVWLRIASFAFFLSGRGIYPNGIERLLD